MKKKCQLKRITTIINININDYLTVSSENDINVTTRSIIKKKTKKL